jgi:hypothetical protein
MMPSVIAALPAWVGLLGVVDQVCQLPQPVASAREHVRFRDVEITVRFLPGDRDEKYDADGTETHDRDHEKDPAASLVAGVG